MLTLKDVSTANGFQVFGDDEDDLVFYAVPTQPRLVVRENGMPHMSFIKYTDSAGATSGALCIFDVEYCVPPEDMAKIEQEMSKRKKGKPVTIKTPQYLDGRVKLLIKKDNKLIQEVKSTGHPSLVGTNMASFYATLTQAGAEVFGSALRNKGGFIQVAYELTMPVRFGSMEVTISYETEQILSCMETIANRTRDDKEGFRQAVNSAYESRQLGRVEINNTMAGVSDEFKNRIETEVKTWALLQLAKQMENQLAKVTGVTPEERKRFEELAQKDLEEHKGKGVRWWWWWYYEKGQARSHELENNVKEVTNFEASYSQRSVFNWKLYPNGTLKPISEEQWPKVCTEVPIGDDPFFKKLQVPINVNADFEKLGIFNVCVTIEYAGQPNPFIFGANKPAGEASKPAGGANKPADEASKPARSDPVQFVGAFKEASGYKYAYWYEVNFEKGLGSYKSERFQDCTGPLTINVAERGMLSLDITNPLPFLGGGEDDDKVETLIIDLRAPGTEHYTLKKTLKITEASAGDEGQIFKVTPGVHHLPSYEYRVTYLQADGSQFSSDWTTSSETMLDVPPPAIEFRRIIGVGLDSDIERIDLELVYRDGNYVKEARKTLSKAKSTLAWRVPVRALGVGSWSYKATTVYSKESGKKRQTVSNPNWTAHSETIGTSDEDA
jgi:hypothetical protein